MAGLRFEFERAVIWPKSLELNQTLGIDVKFMRGSALGFVLRSAR